EPEGGRGGRERRHFGRGRRPAHAAAARRGDPRLVGQEDEPRGRRARGGDPHGLRGRGRRGTPVPGIRLARRADRAGGGEVLAAAVRPGDGGVRCPACRGRARRDQAHRGEDVAVATEVILPRLGQGMESGTIVRWLKSEGEPVQKGEALFELDTDKVTQEVEAEAAGVLLKIAVAEGEVPVGQTVAFIGAEGEDVPDVAAAAPPTEASNTVLQAEEEPRS